MTVSRDQFDRLCAGVHAGEFTESQVMWWMHYDGWPGHTPLECWQWWDGEYRAWKRRNGIPLDNPGRAGKERPDTGADSPGRTRTEAGRG